MRSCPDTDIDPLWFLLRHCEPQSGNAKLLLLIIPIGIRAYEFCFYNNYRNSHALIGLLSISGQTHKFKIHATRHRARAGNSTICYRKKQIDVSF